MGLIQALKACKDTQLWDKGAFCIPTFPGSSAAWKPGPRKEILSNRPLHPHLPRAFSL